jgi:hypothetical protein
MRLLAEPWWVNLLVLVPAVCFSLWRHTGLALSGRTLALAAVFGIAFGFVEAAVVAYLRAAAAAATVAGDPLVLQQIPPRLLGIEIAREAATITMLVAVAFLAAARGRERWALFLYVFALWDLTYYAGLRVLIGWPASLTDLDVLFLIPVPWIAAVWFPVLVSGLAVTAVLLGARRRGGPAG